MESFLQTTAVWSCVLDKNLEHDQSKEYTVKKMTDIVLISVVSHVFKIGEGRDTHLVSGQD